MEDFSELYYQEPYVREFEATVTRCDPAGEPGRWEVELDRTAFYPEGGGQPGDQGALWPAGQADAPASGAGDPAATAAPAPDSPDPGAGAEQGAPEPQPLAHVLDTVKRGDAVVHLADAALPLGARVRGELDWDRRLDNMEAHTGEHILSGIVHGLFGYDNVGFHMGQDSIEVDFNGELDEEQALDVERRANAAVRADLPVQALVPSPAELASMEYRSKKELEGPVRIVRIPGVDSCACCGTHLERTGMVGLVKIVRVESKKKGTRVELLCGRRALEAYEDEMAQARGISALLSAKPGQILDAVRRLADERDGLRRQLKEARRRILGQAVEALPAGGGLVVHAEDGLDAEELRFFCNQAVSGGKASTCAALSASEDGGRLNYVVASSALDLRGPCKELNARLAGRGGGRPEMVQGSFAATAEEAEAALRELLGGQAG